MLRGKPSPHESVHNLASPCGEDWVVKIARVQSDGVELTQMPVMGYCGIRLATTNKVVIAYG